MLSRFYHMCYLYYRLEAVESNEELSDVYAHFRLYYGKDLIAMQNKGNSGNSERFTADKDMQSDPDHSKVLSTKQARRYVHVQVFLITCSYETCNQTGLVVSVSNRECLLSFGYCFWSKMVCTCIYLIIQCQTL